MRRNWLNLGVIVAFGVFVISMLAGFFLGVPLLGFSGMLVFVITLGVGISLVLYDGVVSNLEGPRVNVVGGIVAGLGMLLVFSSGVGRLLSGAEILHRSTVIGLILLLTGLLLQLLDSAARYVRGSYRQRKFGLAFLQILIVVGISAVLGYYDVRFFRMLR